MLSISAPLSAGQASSYHKKDDYYLKEKGLWQGKGAKALGASGQVTEDVFKNLLQGKSKTGGVQLIAKKTGALEEGRDRAAVDLTFSAPKSVSILALADRRIKKAHDQAVTRVLNYIEAHNAQTREQSDCDRQVLNTGNLVIAKFDHLTSRELDPQLHTHCVILNMTQKENGEWRSLHNDSLYKDKMALGRIYRNELAKEITGIGYQSYVTDHRQSFFEVKGIDPELIEDFSKRRQQVLDKAEELKQSGAYPHATDSRLKEIAALSSRKIKPEELDKELLKKDWDTVINGKGFTVQGLREEAQKQAGIEGKRRDPRTALDLVKKAMVLKTQDEAVFLKNDLLAEAAKQCLGTYSLNDLDQAFDELAAQGELVFLGEQKAIRQYSSKHMQQMEADIIAMVNESKGRFRPFVDKAAVTAHLDAYEQGERILRPDFKLTQGQRDAAMTVLTSQDAVNIIQGPAGSGKTAYVRQVRDMVAGKSAAVIGIGFTGKAASELDKAGIPAMTIDSFLNRKIEFLDSGQKPSDDKAFGIKKGSILIMDEASMTGSRHFYKVLSLANEGRLKLVIQGDKRQLPSISAGRMHDILQQKAGVDKVVMTQAVRQRQGSQAHKAVQAFKGRLLTSSIAELRRQKNVLEYQGRDEGLKAVTKAALEDRQEGSSLVLTDKNKDRIGLNEMIRTRLVEKGELDKGGRCFEILSSANISAGAASSANSYEVGQELVAKSKISDQIGAGAKLQVTAVDNNANVLSVAAKDGSAHSIDVGRHWHRISAFDRAEREFAKGDSIVFSKNDRKLGVLNGNMGKISSIDERGNVTAVLDSKKTISFNLDVDGPGSKADSRFKYNYIDHAYAVTLHRSQGMSVDRTVVFHDAKSGMTSANSVYVGITRARESIRIFTSNFNDKEGPNLMDQARVWEEKSSTLDYEPVAVKKKNELDGLKGLPAKDQAGIKELARNMSRRDRAAFMALFKGGGKGLEADDRPPDLVAAHFKRMEAGLVRGRAKGVGLQAGKNAEKQIDLNLNMGIGDA